MQIENYFEAGRAGIEHALLPEMGLVTAGDCVIGADSHTCTYGALGAFSTGVGSTDMACAMAVGKTWFKVPSAIRVRLRGRLSRYVTGKDVILELIGRIGVDGALYKSLEFCGDIGEISMDGRFAICNMAVEAGAKNGIFEVDENTLEYLRAHNAGEPVIFEADEDAEYEQEIEIRLDDVPLTVAYPSLPENTRPAAEGKDIKIDQAVIGSCTNGRMEDMRAAAEILRGRKVHPDVRCIIIPATQNIWRQCAREGLFDIFAQAGCVVSAPTCGPCLGGYMGILAEGERAVSTTNRNFIGRMGHVKSEVYLSGPYVAAASAVRGYISTPDML
jgi:3-isopropylmalate dehydratase large subunit